MAFTLDPEQAETHVIYELVDFDGKDVLEIGCGDGRLTWRYAAQAASVLALDSTAADVERAQASTPDVLRATVTFQVADITTVDLSRSAFDIAVLSWSL